VAKSNEDEASGLALDSRPEHAPMDADVEGRAAIHGAIVRSKSASHSATSLRVDDCGATNGTAATDGERHSARCSSACVRTQPRHARRRCGDAADDRVESVAADDGSLPQAPLADGRGKSPSSWGDTSASHDGGTIDS
jgi:hypothetical protein